MPEKVPVPLIAILAVWIILALPAVALPAAPEIFLQEEPETYLVVDKLEDIEREIEYADKEIATGGYMDILCPHRWKIAFRSLAAGMIMLVATFFCRNSTRRRPRLSLQRKRISQTSPWGDLQPPSAFR